LGLVGSEVATPDIVAAYKKTREAQVLVSWVRNQYEQAKSARSRITLTWNMNLAFYYGNQYMEITPIQGGRLYMPRVPPHRVRQVANRIRPLIRSELSRITSQKPSASAVPASAEDEDLAAAYAAEQVWESVSNTEGLDAQFEQTAFWTLLTGTAFLKTWWDKTAVDDDGNPGKIRFDCITPYNLFVPDLRQFDIQKQPFIINAYARPVEWINRFYNGLIDPVVADVISTSEILSDATLNLSSGERSEPDSVLCLELWAKPGAHPLLPNGGMVYIISDQLVAVSPTAFPYKHGQYPFTKFDHILTGKFYSESSILDLIGLQREYNRTRSQIVEAKNRMAKPQLIIAKGSVDVSKITTEPGLAIEYKVGLPEPKPLTLTPLPSYVLQELDRIILDMEDISGQHAVSKGNVPSGVTAATAISYLQEKDDSILSTTYASVERGLEDVAKQTLGLIQQFWDIPRTVKVVGSDGFFDVLQLTGAQLSTDIRMEGGSSLPTSKAARQAFIMDMMKMGFIPPEDGLRLLEIGGVQQLNRKLKVDESQAQRENIKMKRLKPEEIVAHQQQTEQMQQQAMMQQDPSMGGMDPSQQGDMPVDQETGMPMDPPALVPVNNWDNHAVHIEVHNNFRKTQAFEMLSEPTRELFEQHVQAHVQAVNDAMAQVDLVRGGGMPPEMPPEMGGGAPPEDAPPDAGDPNGAPPDMGGM
jgi:hypothetical protein